MRNRKHKKKISVESVGMKKKKNDINSDNQETEICQSDASNDRQETDNGNGYVDAREHVQNTGQSSLHYREKLPESKQTNEQHKTVDSQTGLLAHVPEVVTDYVKQNEKAAMLKVVTTKTFNKGLMDISLLTSNATQLREVILHPAHPFYSVVLCLISVSIVLQVTSTLLMLTSDYLKGSTKDSSSNLFRKKLSYITMALISLVTVLNVLISVFHIPGGIPVAPSQVS